MHHRPLTNASGTCGANDVAIDVAFMSTTLDFDVAMRYALAPSNASKGGGNFGLILEIQQSFIDRGADLSWLSQCARAPRLLCRGSLRFAAQRRLNLPACRPV